MNYSHGAKMDIGNLLVCVLCDDFDNTRIVANILKSFNVPTLNLTHDSIGSISSDLLRKVGFDLVIVDNDFLSKVDLMEFRQALPESKIIKFPSKSENEENLNREIELLENILLSFLPSNGDDYPSSSYAPKRGGDFPQSSPRYLQV